MLKVGLIGFGAIGRTVAEHWDSELAKGATLCAICVRPDRVEQVRAAVAPGVTVVSDVAAMLALGLDLVIEAAGHAAVRSEASRVLRAGCDLYLLSAGALADDALRLELEASAAAGNTRLCIPAGALAGFDGLLAQRQQGLVSVRYTSTKPPLAWAGTVAEEEVALASITAPVVLFEGSAREAARRYPKNANLAAAVALAGLGLDDTRVMLVADPHVTTNGGVIEARGTAGEVQVAVRGAPAGDNPKTSAVVGMSVLAALKNRLSAISFV